MCFVHIQQKTQKLIIFIDCHYILVYNNSEAGGYLQFWCEKTDLYEINCKNARNYNPWVISVYHSFLWAASFLCGGTNGPPLDTVSQTDFVLPVSTPSSVSGVQVKNILSAISLTLGTVNDLRFNLRIVPLSGITDTAFRFYDYNKEDAWAFSFTDTTDTDGKFVVTYDPEESRPSGEPFLYCCYNTTDDVALAKQAISLRVEYGQMSEDIYIGQGDEFVLTHTKVLLGDINNNNVIDEADFDLLCDAWSDPSALSLQQFLAADVTMDGAITADDMLMHQKYRSGTILSFWGTDGIVPITNSVADGTGHKYTLYNHQQETYFMTYDSSDYISFGNSGGAVTTNNLLITGGETSTIQNVFSNKYLALTRNENGYYKCCFTENTADPTIHWYIVKHNNNYYLVNSQHTDKVVGTNFRLTRSLFDAKWDLKEQSRTISYFYNYGYRQRFWQNWDNGNNVSRTSDAVDQAIVAQLQQYQTRIDDVLTKTFGLAITMVQPELICSAEDLCYTSNHEELSHTQMLQEIGTNEIMDESETHTACIHSSPTLCSMGMPYHHRNGSAGLDYMETIRETNNETDRIYLLTSGYNPCDVRPREEDEDGDGHVNHAYSAIAGLASPLSGVCGVYHADNSHKNVNDVAALHEICHCLGAGGKADTPHDQCVMSYNSDWNYITQLMKAQSAIMNRKVFCNDCYNAVVTYLKYN